MSKYYRAAVAIAIIMVTTVTMLNSASAVRIKDITVIQGIRDNQLMGFGLVTGLNGQGDSRSFRMTRQMLSRLAENHGFVVESSDVASKNVAAVLVTARVKPFARTGEAIDITISSIGDAKSLQGGILLQTPLKGANGAVYAVAQGRVVAGSSTQDAQNTASLPEGALVERDIVSSFIDGNRIRVILKYPDFVTISQLQEVIEGINNDTEVTAVDPGLLEITLSGEALANPVAYIAQLEALTVVPDNEAVVVIDKKTGLIVTGERVVIQPCTVSTAGAQVTVGTGSSGENSFQVQSETVGGLVSILNQMGLESNEIISMLEAVHAAGAINARIIVL
jgi:flagellar P-ring protein precursor FlgI